MSKRKERGSSVLRDANEVIDTEINRRLLNANTAMNDININPRAYGIAQKQETVDDLNWAVNIALPKNEVTGRFIVGKRDDQEDADAGIYLKPYDEK